MDKEAETHRRKKQHICTAVVVQGLQRMNHTDFDESPKLSCGATHGLTVLAFSLLCGEMT